MSVPPPTNVGIHYFRQRTGTWSARIEHRGQTWVVRSNERHLGAAMLAIAGWIGRHPVLSDPGLF